MDVDVDGAGGAPQGPEAGSAPSPPASAAHVDMLATCCSGVAGLLEEGSVSWILETRCGALCTTTKV